MFTIHQLDNPNEDTSIFLDGWSFLWASLFGPIYILVHGFGRRALAMLGISCVIAVITGVCVIVLLAAVDGEELRTIVLVGLIVLGLSAQGGVALHLVFTAYLRRGWRVGY